MTAEEKVAAAMTYWVETFDPPPTGITQGTWICVILQHSPEPISNEEINEVGRKHWGEHWIDIAEVGEESSPWTPIKNYTGDNDPF
jgi:hypothetical protein